MRSIAFDFSATLNDWALPCAAVVLSALGVWIARWALARLGNRPRLHALAELSAPLSNLVILIGLRIFVDAAPLSTKVGLWVESGIYILGVFLVLRLGRRAGLLVLEWGSFRGNHSETLQQGFIPLIRNLISLFVFFAGAIMILKHLGYDVMSLLTALGVGSLAVGLAAKDTLSNMISGFTLIIDRNMKPGDRINLGGDQTGDVDEIGLRSTRIRTSDGNMLIVPNSELVNTKILNLSVPSRAASTSVKVKIPAQVAFEDFRKLCEASLHEIPELSKKRGSSVLLSSLDGGVQTVSIGFWVENPDDAGTAQSSFHEKLLARMRQARVELAPP